MNKRFMKIVLFAAIIAAAGWNISQSEKGAKLSDVALENVEALTGGEDGGGIVYAQSIIITDRGSRIECRSGTLYLIESYSVACIGNGNLPCTSGYYERITNEGRCYGV